MKIIEDLISTGAREVTPESLDRAVRNLPQLRARMASLRDAHVDLTQPLEFLSQVLEDFSGGMCRDLPYHAIADLAFAVQYLDSEVDLIPDHLPDVGYADDAAVINIVLARHSSLLREHALDRGFAWDQLLAM